MNLPVADQPRPPEKPPASSRFQFATGDRPLSGYTIKRGVGRGGFGEVYFAVSDGGKEVALKLIRRNLDVELRGVQHCLNLKHPNLIALYDVRRDGDEDDCWIVMEYVAGESLEGAIRRHPHGMPADEAVDWLRGIAAGASYLHSHGIVHRDLKPGNVFREDSTVKLGDYGLSKFISCSRRSGQTESVGTVHYMAPEIAHGRYGREIDIYALGVILYEMLTGRVPFDGESVGEVLMKHLTAQPDVSLLPPAYRPVVARALAKDPAVRFSSIEQFLAALPGAGQEPAAAAPKPSFSAEPEFHRGGNSAAPRAPSPPVQDAFTLFSPAVVLGTIGLLLVLMTGARLPLVMIGFALLAGLAIYASANRRTRGSAGPHSASQPWPATSDVPPPLPNSAAVGSPVVPSLATPLAGLPPDVVGILGAVLAPMALALLLAIGRVRGNPSSLTLIALPLLGGFAAYWWAKSRARRQSGARRGPTSEFPAPLPTGGQPAVDPAAETSKSTDGFSAPAAALIGAVFVGLVLPLVICFALDFATNFPDLADAVRPIQNEIRTSGASSKVLVLTTLALIGGFASYLATSGKASQPPLGVHPLAAGVSGSVLSMMAVHRVVGAKSFSPPENAMLWGLILLGGIASYAWAKNRRRQLAGSKRSQISADQRNLSSTPAPASPSVAYAMGRFVGRSDERAMPALVVKTARERLIELLESLLVSAAVATVLAVIAAACQRGESGAEEVAWFALSGSLGAWAVLVLSKLWEGTRGEPFLRRFAMLVVGLGVGAGSYGLDRLLMVRLPFNQSLRPSRWHIDWDFYNRLDGAPHLDAYLAYFGLMFFLVPWWRQADPLRPARVRVGAIAWTLFVAFLLNLICPFPQPWGAIVAAIISLSVQVASPLAMKTNRWATGGQNGSN